MPVLVERVDYSRMARGKDPVVNFMALVREGDPQSAVFYTPPTGKEPVLSVKFDAVDKKQARIYVVKEGMYIPIWMDDQRLQLLVSDAEGDDFPEQRLATLTPGRKVFELPIKKNGENTGSRVVFKFIDPSES